MVRQLSFSFRVPDKLAGFGDFVLLGVVQVKAQVTAVEGEGFGVYAFFGKEGGLDHREGAKTGVEDGVIEDVVIQGGVEALTNLNEIP
jgi:hypothetical protein